MTVDPLLKFEGPTDLSSTCSQYDCIIRAVSGAAGAREAVGVVVGLLRRGLIAVVPAVVAVCIVYCFLNSY